MLSEQEIKSAAQRIDKAEKNREQTRQLSLQHPAMTVEDAYAVQDTWVKMKINEGRSIKGRKIGLTSRAMQQSSQIDEPDYGTLLDDMFFDDGADVPLSRFISPRLEVELAFILKQPLQGANLTIEDVLTATDCVMPAVEIIDARIHRLDPDTGRPRKVFDTISDNAANAGIIMGGKAIGAKDMDLRWASGLLYRNDVIEETGVAAGVLDHPANGIAWLARKFTPHNIALEPGHIILSGSFTRPVAIRVNDTFRIDYGELGQINCRFV